MDDFLRGSGKDSLSGGAGTSQDGHTHSGGNTTPGGYTARWRDESHPSSQNPFDDISRANGRGSATGEAETGETSHTRPGGFAAPGGYTTRWREPQPFESLIRPPQEFLSQLQIKPLYEKVDSHQPIPFKEADGWTSSAPNSGKSRNYAVESTVIDSSKSLENLIKPTSVMTTIRELVTAQYVSIDVLWDVDGFFSEELTGQRDFPSILTLTGTINKGYATTCRDYVGQFWPDFGLEVMEKVLLVTQGWVPENDSSTRFEVQSMDIKIRKLDDKKNLTQFNLIAAGTTEDLIKLVELLTWITAVFRRPRHGQLSYSTPNFAVADGLSKFKIEPAALQPIGAEELCWCSMFEGSVIAKGFPVPDRNDEVGLEMTFNLMVMLGRIWHPMEYMDGFVLKGRSTILVPTKKSSKSVQWHFLRKDNPQKKISMRAIRFYCQYVVENVPLEELQTARTFVGWVINAQVHAGARTSGFEWIRDSKAPYPPRRPEFAKEVSSSIGTSGLGFFNVNFGGKLIIPQRLYGPIKEEHILMEDMLLNSMENSSLLWDVGTGRGWMVSELAALLMIIHAWASRQTDSEALLSKLPFTQQSSNEGKSSYNAIRAHRTLQLRSAGDGGEDLMFMTQVKSVLAALESRKEEIITRASGYSRLFYGKHLTGWEMVDIASFKPWFKKKRISLDDTCGTWPSVLEKQHETVVLFCRGVRDLIQPLDHESYCQTWQSVPKDRSYLAATVASITNLDIYCRTDNRFKGCDFNGKICSSRLQEVHHKQSDRAIQIPQNGAIIVGRSHHSLYKICSPATTQPHDQDPSAISSSENPQGIGIVVNAEDTGPFALTSQPTVGPGELCSLSSNNETDATKGRIKGRRKRDRKLLVEVE